MFLRFIPSHLTGLVRWLSGQARKSKTDTYRITRSNRGGYFRRRLRQCNCTAKFTRHAGVFVKDQ
jgi:hypothetical protein